MSGVECIAAERKRQIEQEGWTPEHDDAHIDGELAQAAGAYALHGAMIVDGGRYFRAPGGCGYFRGVPLEWPDGWDWDWWKPKDRRHDLVRAGALIAAEIDRLDRLEARQKSGDEAVCEICGNPLAPDDLCATDIELGCCHAACLDGSPVVDLETGEPVDGPLSTYRFSS